jgi:hypothetical protein
MLFLDEILTASRFRFFFTGIDGLFDGSEGESGPRRRSKVTERFRRPAPRIIL